MESVSIRNVNISKESPRVVGNVGNLEEAKGVLAQKADVLEIRCDLVAQANAEAITETVKAIRQEASSVPIIATIRKTSDGGDWYRFMRPDQARLPIFSAIAEHVDGVDIEFSAAIRDDVIEMFKIQHKSVILSYHNFQCTPDILELKDTIAEMTNTECDIIKIACMTCDKSDYIELFHLLQDHVKIANSKPLALITMGKLGEPGRKTFPWFGSCLTYGCAKEAKAPSQPTVQELVEFLRLPEQRSINLPLIDTAAGRHDFRALLKLAS